MEISIALPPEISKQGIINLKTFIDQNSIEGIENTKIERKPHGDGQMGAGDLLNKICIIVHAVEKPLTELVVCLQKYVDTFRTEITINDGKGGILTLKSGKKVDPEIMQDVVNKFLQRS